MLVESFNHEKHSDMLKRWLDYYELPLPSKASFSDVGFVVDNTALGFLYTTNSSKAYFDHVASDPYSKKDARGEALDRLIEVLIAEASKRNVEVLQVITRGPLAIRLVKDHSFQLHEVFPLLYRSLI